MVRSDMQARLRAWIPALYEAANVMLTKPSKAVRN